MCAFREIFRYLKDMDKIAVLSACKELRSLIPYAPLRGVYAYEHTLNTPYIFTRVEYIVISDVRPSDEFDVQLPQLPSVPSSVTHLGIMNLDEFALLNDLSPKITHLSVYDDTHWNGYLIPGTITHLDISFASGYDLKYLPESVTHLTINRTMQDLHRIPKSVTHLCIDPIHKIRVAQTIPHGVTHFTYGLSYRGVLVELPETCTHLKVYANLKRNMWLPHITHVKFSGKFNQTIKNCWMPHLTHMVFCKSYKLPISGLIPPGLVYLLYCGKVYRGSEIDVFQ